MDVAGLPLDVRVAIASYIHRQRDIVSLTRSGWALYAAAIPQLYRDLTVCESVDVNHLIAMLSPDNAGLQHIRRLKVVADLGGMYIHNRPSMDRSLQLMGAILAAGIQNITQLQLQIHGPIKTDSGHDLVTSLPGLLHLEIRANLSRYCEATNREDNTDAQRIDASKEILTKIFGRDRFLDAERSKANWADQGNFVMLWNSGKLNGRTKEKLKLRSLSIYQLDLEDPDRLLQVIDCSRLHSLVLQECAHSVKLLASIRPTGLPARISLTHLVLTANDEWPNNNSYNNALDDFLTSFSGLEQLVIHGVMEESIRPSTAAIAAHSSTLRSVFLCCKPSEENEDNPADLEACMKQCSQLEQLALAVPPLKLDAPLAWIKETHGNLLAALAAAPSLRTLRILTVPDEEDLDFELSGDNDTGCRIFVDSAMRTYATEYLSQLPKVNALSLADKARPVDDEIDISELPTEVKYYARSKTIDPYGKIGSIGLDMTSKDQLQDIEPVSDIFDMNPLSGRMMRYGYRA
ncbi:hypothetical protein LTR56_000809 [Elasticomyces elasticus]|nr:hypothetical protein LTR22_009034 [Elasticomyces elasticus]KAK3660433.1 hypothetical protein LTR56_000809 [Elasticomyces elasticus]KAK4929174.1 hypothetical protein LTR49_004071 [Elasticomyces elasticus]KAK5765730.1 hypothetical protein LTS12_003990 [Elasticomyces elasticus]